MELWHMLGIVLSGILVALALIMGWGWLVGIGMVALPVAGLWGLIASGPGSSVNPYRGTSEH